MNNIIMILLCPVIILLGTLMLLAIMFIPRHIYHFFRPVRRPSKQDQYWPPLYGNPVAKCCCSSERDLYMYDDAFHKPGICPECGGVITQEVNPEFKVKLKDWKDLFFTSDGYCIASSRFKQFCEAQDYESVTFVPLGQGPVKNGQLRNVFLRFFIHTFCIQSISPYKEVQEEFFWMRVQKNIPLDLNRELSAQEWSVPIAICHPSFRAFRIFKKVIHWSHRISLPSLTSCGE